MLRRFADARLRSDLDKAQHAQERYRDIARHLAISLKAARQANVAMAADLAEERAEHQATGRKLLLAAGRVDLLRAQLTQQQETQP